MPTYDYTKLQASALSRGLAGFIVAGSGAVVALLAFFALPYASLGGWLSFTGAQLAGMDEGSSLLWLIPLTALIAVMVSAWSIWGKPASQKTLKKSGLILALLGVVSAGLLFIVLLRASEYSSFIGGGFWITLLALIAICFGGYGANRTS